jgi:hypothetical protein
MGEKIRELACESEANVKRREAKRGRRKREGMRRRRGRFMYVC